MTDSDRPHDTDTDADAPDHHPETDGGPAVGTHDHDDAGPNEFGAPAGEEGRTDAADFFVERDADGELLPVETIAEGYGQITVQPLVYGEVEKYFGDEGEIAEAGARSVAQVLRKHILEPDLNAHIANSDQFDASHLTGGVLREEMEPFAPQALLKALLRESGLEDAEVDVDRDGNAAVDLDDSNRGK